MFYLCQIAANNANTGHRNTVSLSPPVSHLPFLKENQNAEMENKQFEQTRKEERAEESTRSGTLGIVRQYGTHLGRTF
jgi:hypothetical protein